MFGLSLPPQVQALQIFRLVLLQLTTLHLRFIKEIAPLWLLAMVMTMLALALLRRSLQFLATQVMSSTCASADMPEQPLRMAPLAPER
jgi:hypothetical protein